MRTVFRATLRKLCEEATSLQDISKCDFIHPAFVFKADRLISRYCIPSRNKKTLLTYPSTEFYHPRISGTSGNISLLSLCQPTLLHIETLLSPQWSGKRRFYPTLNKRCFVIDPNFMWMFQVLVLTETKSSLKKTSLFVGQWVLEFPRAGMIRCIG